LSTHSHDAFDPAIANLIRSKAARLRRCGWLNEPDLEDLSQDCRVELLRKLGRYDPSRGAIEAYAARVLKNFLANCLRNRVAQRRDPRSVTTLGEIDGSDRVPQVAKDRFRRDRRSSLEQSDLSHDLLTVLGLLPPDLQDLALRLKYQSVAAAARELGIPRTTVQSRIRKLRVIFERHDLKEYLRRPSSFRDATG
jgi:RNA polymerase sigma factor (sigma-70 family)